MPNVSIITPAHIDTEEKVEWFDEMLGSVRNQSMHDWEIIIIDDCSPHNLDQLKAKYSDPRFRWFKSPRQQGPSLCRNTAVALSEAEAIVALDSDDKFPDDALYHMHEAWQQNPDLVVYGNLQQLRYKHGKFELGKVFQLPDYVFERTLKFQGIMPVTAMHSKNCHNAAGGWKSEFEFGIEDIEYWIAAGKAGYCGQRISHTTLIYRKHSDSRSYNLRNVNRQETDMRRKIAALHTDVYNGRKPMGCCGGSGSDQNFNNTNYNTAAAMSGQIAAASLDQFSAQEKVWIEYKGARTSKFGVKGAFTGIEYNILGRGFVFQAHVNDTSKFKRSGRGQDFAIGVPAPAGHAEPEPKPEETFTPPEPELAQIERIDKQAMETRGLVPTPSVPVERLTNLSELDLSESIRETLESEGFTVEGLAQVEVYELTPYAGIGEKTAEKLIEKARLFLDNGSR